MCGHGGGGSKIPKKTPLQSVAKPNRNHFKRSKWSPYSEVIRTLPSCLTDNETHPTELTNPNLNSLLTVQQSLFRVEENSPSRTNEQVMGLLTKHSRFK